MIIKQIHVNTPPEVRAGGCRKEHASAVGVGTTGAVFAWGWRSFMTPHQMTWHTVAEASPLTIYKYSFWKQMESFCSYCSMSFCPLTCWYVLELLPSVHTEAPHDFWVLHTITWDASTILYLTICNWKNVNCSKFGAYKHCYCNYNCSGMYMNRYENFSIIYHQIIIVYTSHTISG